MLCLQESAAAFFAQVNERVFSCRLPSDMEISWNSRLRAVSGRAFAGVDRNGYRYSFIELSTKIVNSRERLFQVLAHEISHVAAWVLEGSLRPHHGPVFWKNAAKIERVCAPPPQTRVPPAAASPTLCSVAAPPSLLASDYK
jgi:predicted SprT family Zn-dependent metalloprotease